MRVQTAVIGLLTFSMYIALAASAKAQCSDQYVTTTTDRFSGATTTETHLPYKGEPFVVDIRQIVAGKKRSFTLTIAFVGADYPRHNCAVINILADGKRVPVRDSSMPYPLAPAEMFVAGLNTSSVAQLGKASKIEIKVCNDELTASPEFVEAAHEFACKVKRPAAS